MEISLEQLYILSAHTNHSKQTKAQPARAFTASLYCLDGTALPLLVAQEDARRMLAKTTNTLIWLELDGDFHHMLVLVAGDPRHIRANHLELHEVEENEEISAFSLVRLSASEDDERQWDVVDPWIKVSGPAQRVAAGHHLVTREHAYREILARDVKLLFRTKLMSDPEQVLFKSDFEPEQREEDKRKVAIAVEGIGYEAAAENAYFVAAEKLLRNRLTLCSACDCAMPSMRICLSKDIYSGKL